MQNNTEIKNKEGFQKKKKFNGHLRKNSSIKKKLPIEDVSYPDDELEPISTKQNTINPLENEIFSFLQQKSGVQKETFWDKLNILLKDKKFSEIIRNDMNLITYSILYEATDIYEELMDSYGLLVSKVDIEKSILKLCLNKHPKIISKTIDFYSKNYESPTSEYINTFLSQACKNSYREDNNQLFIDWLSKKMNDDNKSHFWNTCFQNKNIPFILLALKNTELKSFLQNNTAQYQTLITSSGIENGITKALNTNIVKKISYTDSEIIKENNSSNNVFLGNPEEQLQNLNRDNKSTGPEIVIKKRKKLL